MLEYVKRKKRLTESETRRFMLQMLDGVRFLHQTKVIHRDLKLGNLFLGRGDEIKMGDFGLACKLQFDGERKRTLCGTPNYIAPEVLEGKNGHSYEVDMWSIGVVMYTCLVGKPPFETSDVKSTYKLIKSNSYSFPDRLHISEGAKALVRRILQSEPENRPSIDDVLSDSWFLGEGTALIHQSKSLASGLSSLSTERTSALPSSLSSVMGSASEGHRAPLQPIQDTMMQQGRGASALDCDVPSTNKYSDPLGSRTTSCRPLDGVASALERNVTASTTSHYTSALDRLDSARSTSSALTSGTHLLRPASAAAALQSDKGAPSLSSFAVTSTYSSSAASDYLARRTAGAIGSSSNVYAAMSNLPATSSVADRPMSAIVNSAGSTTPTKRLTKQLETMDLQRDAALDAGAARQAENSSAASASAGAAPRVGDGEDQLSLQSMHTNIKSVLVHAPPTSTASSTKKDPPVSYLPLPSVWVSRWVDYSKKYGLGYKLSNGLSGVFFNDATKMLLETDGDSLEYIERMRREDGAKYDVRKPQSLKGHPPELTKKVTLMEHFKNYLDETHPNRDSPLHQPNAVPSTQEEGAGGVYVRKWMRTRHSIIFRLSNNNFQVFMHVHHYICMHTYTHTNVYFIHSVYRSSVLTTRACNHFCLSGIACSTVHSHPLSLSPSSPLPSPPPPPHPPLPSPSTPPPSPSFSNQPLNGSLFVYLYIR